MLTAPATMVIIRRLKLHRADIWKPQAVPSPLVMIIYDLIAMLEIQLYRASA